MDIAKHEEMSRQIVLSTVDLCGQIAFSVYPDTIAKLVSEGVLVRKPRSSKFFVRA